MKDFEQILVQNSALGATALWEFVRAYFDSRAQTHGPNLLKSLLVLPIVLHRRSAEGIYRMASESGLLKALNDEPLITAGLQLRLESFTPLSFRSVKLALSSSLLSWDGERPIPRLSPKRKTLPGALTPGNADVNMILLAARRLGWWFATEDLDGLCLQLRVRF